MDATWLGMGTKLQSIWSAKVSQLLINRQDVLADLRRSTSQVARSSLYTRLVKYVESFRIRMVFSEPASMYHRHNQKVVMNRASLTSVVLAPTTWTQFVKPFPLSPTHAPMPEPPSVFGEEQISAPWHARPTVCTNQACSCVRLHVPTVTQNARIKKGKDVNVTRVLSLAVENVFHCQNAVAAEREDPTWRKVKRA